MKKPPGTGNIGARGVRKLVSCGIEAAGRRLHCGSARLPLAHGAKVGSSQEIGKCFSEATVLRASIEEDCVISALLCSALLCSALLCSARKRSCRPRKRLSPQFEEKRTEAGDRAGLEHSMEPIAGETQERKATGSRSTRPCSFFSWVSCVSTSFRRFIFPQYLNDSTRATNFQAESRKNRKMHAF